MGEGGAITTNDKALADHMRLHRSHGLERHPEGGAWFYEMNQMGFNYRATDMQCALGVSQMKKLPRFIAQRQKLARLYDELLAPHADTIAPPHRMEGQEPAWHLYAVRIAFDHVNMTRDAMMKVLSQDYNIGTQVHYIPVHTQPYYEGLYGAQDLKGAARYYDRILSLRFTPR